MTPCQEIIRILSSSEDISWVRRAELKMHLMMCKHCARYSSHLSMMRDSFKTLFAKITQVNPSQVQKLEDEVIERIKQIK